MSSKELTEIRRRFVEAGGNFTQSLGVGRVLGQIYAYMFFSPEPQTLDDLKEALGISKGAASMAVRQLAQWGAVRRVWVKGERKDYYEATDELGNIIRKALVDLVGRQMEVGDHLLDDVENMVSGKNRTGKDTEETDFLRKRIQRLRAFRTRGQKLWQNSILRMFLKR